MYVLIYHVLFISRFNYLIVEQGNSKNYYIIFRLKSTKIRNICFPYIILIIFTLYIFLVLPTFNWLNDKTVHGQPLIYSKTLKKITHQFSGWKKCYLLKFYHYFFFIQLKVSLKKFALHTFWRGATSIEYFAQLFAKTVRSLRPYRYSTSSEKFDSRQKNILFNMIPRCIIFTKKAF